MTQPKKMTVDRLREGHLNLSEATALAARIPRELTDIQSEESAETLRKFLEDIEHHMLHEEEIFETVENSEEASEELKDLIASIREEHEIFREKGEGIRNFIASASLPIEEGDADRLGLMVADYGDTLLTHARLEDEELFPRLDKHLEES